MNKKIFIILLFFLVFISLLSCAKSDEETSTHIHCFEDWIVTKEPTCQENGEAQRICSEDNYVETKNIEALGHNYELVDKKEPTCFESGFKEYLCIRCKNRHVERDEALGHDLHSYDAKEPTYTTCGWDSYEKCSRCGYTTFEKKYIDGIEIKNIALDAKIDFPQRAFEFLNSENGKYSKLNNTNRLNDSDKTTTLYSYPSESFSYDLLWDEEKIISKIVLTLNTSANTTDETIENGIYIKMFSIDFYDSRSKKIYTETNISTLNKVGEVEVLFDEYIGGVSKVSFTFFVNTKNGYKAENGLGKGYINEIEVFGFDDPNYEKGNTGLVFIDITNEATIDIEPIPNQLSYWAKVAGIDRDGNRIKGNSLLDRLIDGDENTTLYAPIRFYEPNREYVYYLSFKEEKSFKKVSASVNSRIGNDIPHDEDSTLSENVYNNSILGFSIQILDENDNIIYESQFKNTYTYETVEIVFDNPIKGKTIKYMFEGSQLWGMDFIRELYAYVTE